MASCRPVPPRSTDAQVEIPRPQRSVGASSSRRSCVVKVNKENPPPRGLISTRASRFPRKTFDKLIEIPTTNRKPRNVLHSENGESHPLACQKPP